MNGKCSVVFTISEFNGDPQVTTRCLVRRANSVIKKNSNNNALIVKPKHEIKRLETVQYILALHNKLNELDAVDKATTKVRVDNLDAEFIHAKRKDSDEYYDLVIINMGTKEVPIMRNFYLSDTQSGLIRTPGFKPEYEFTLTERPVEDDAEEDSEDEE